MSKRVLFYILILVTSVLGAKMVSAEVVPQHDAVETEQVIRINTHKFEFTPNVIKLKKGVPVILEFTATDVIMGFNAPDFKSRATIVPGKVVRVRIVPQQVGEFTFFCDVFCGDGHEDMTGMISVTA